MKQLVIFFFLFWLASCTRCPDDVIPQNSLKIDFSNLAVGQESRYARLTAQKYWSESDTTYKNGNDTLILRIESQDEFGFKVSESHTSLKIATLYYYFKVVGDSLFVKPLPQMSLLNSMVFSPAPQSFFLKDTGQPVLTLNKWWLPKDVGITEGVGRVLDVRINNILYDKTLVDYNFKPIAFDGQAIVKIYTRTNGFISFQAVGGFTQTGLMYNLF